MQILLRSVLFFPLALLIGEYGVLFWIVLAVSSFQNMIMNPFQNFPELKPLMELTNFYPKLYLKYSNLIFLISVNIVLVPLLFILLLLNKILFIEVLSCFFIINVLFLILTLIGNIFYFSDLQEIKSSITHFVLNALIFQLSMFFLVGLVLFIYMTAGHKLIYMTFLLSISVIIWHISMRKYNYKMYYTYK